MPQILKRSFEREARDSSVVEERQQMPVKRSYITNVKWSQPDQAALAPTKAPAAKRAVVSNAKWSPGQQPHVAGPGPVKIEPTSIASTITASRYDFVTAINSASLSAESAATTDPATTSSSEDSAPSSSTPSSSSLPTETSTPSFDRTSTTEQPPTSRSVSTREASSDVTVPSSSTSRRNQSTSQAPVTTTQPIFSSSVDSTTDSVAPSRATYTSLPATISFASVETTITSTSSEQRSSRRITSTIDFATVTTRTLSLSSDHGATRTTSIATASNLVTVQLTATDGAALSSQLSSLYASYASAKSISAVSATSTSSGMADAPTPPPLTTQVIKFSPPETSGSDTSQTTSTDNGSGGESGQSKALLNTFSKSPISITFTVFICLAIGVLTLAVIAFLVRRSHRRRKRERIGLALGSDDGGSPRGSWRASGASLNFASPNTDIAPEAIWARRRESGALRDLEDQNEDMVEVDRPSSEWTSMVGDHDFGSDFASSRGHGSFGARGQVPPPMPLGLPTLVTPHPLRNAHYPDPVTPSQYSMAGQSPDMIVTPPTPARATSPVSPKSPYSPSRPPRPDTSSLSYLNGYAKGDVQDPFSDAYDIQPVQPAFKRTFSDSTTSSSATRFAYMPPVLASQRPVLQQRPRYASSIIGSQSLLDHASPEREYDETALRRAMSLNGPPSPAASPLRNTLIPLSPRHSTLVGTPESLSSPTAANPDDSISNEVGMAMTSDSAQWAYIEPKVPEDTIGLFKPDFLSRSPRSEAFARVSTSESIQSNDSSEMTDTSTVRPTSRARLAVPLAAARHLTASRTARDSIAASSSSDSGRDSPAPQIHHAMSASRRKVSVVDVVAASPATLRDFDDDSPGSDESSGSETTQLAKRRRSEQEDIARALMLERRRRSEGEVIVRK